MRATPRAEALRASLKTLLAEMRDLIDPPVTPLAEIRQTVRILAADHPMIVLAQPLLTQLRRTAPGIDIIFRPWNGTEASQSALVSGETDLAIALFDRDVRGIERRALLFETYVVAMRHDHPAAAAFDLDAWLAWPHIVVSGRGEARTSVDNALVAIGKERRVGLVVPFFHPVPDLLLGTDFIAMLPRSGVPASIENQFAVFEPPIPVDGFPLHIAWHERKAGDRALRHVIEVVVLIFDGLFS